MKRIYFPLDFDTVSYFILELKGEYHMEHLTISQVSKRYEVTPRMLRYYEKLGLIRTLHKEDYAYRLYDEEAVRRLQQIIVLRKLRIPLKQIAIILQDEKQQEALRLLKENLTQLDGEIEALDLIREFLRRLTSSLEESLRRKVRFDMLDDSTLTEMAGVLSFPKTNLKENTSMSDLNKAEETLNKSLPVRILLLPPCTVAACHYIGENPEEHVGDRMVRFIKESGLYIRKPDARMFGFNHPNPGVLEGGVYGYEKWVTIPEDMELPEYVEKKKFAGGLYAVLTIEFGDFHLWEDLTKWANESKEFEPNYSELGQEIMGGGLEEHLNWVYAAHTGRWEDGMTGQLDLMLPIRHRK